MENTQLSKPHEQEDKKKYYNALFKSVCLMLILGYMVYNRV